MSIPNIIKPLAYTKNLLCLSFTIMQGMLQRGRGASPISYRIETSGSERSRVSFLHDFGGCGVCVVIFDRRDAIHEGGSIVSELDKAYLPLVVQVLQKVMEISRSVVGGSLLKQYIGSGKDEYSALTMRAELDRLCRSEANLAAETALGLSDVALIHNHSLQYCMPKENLVTSLVSCHSSAAVQMDRGSRLVLQGGARMHQSTNPVTNPELYHSYAAIQRRDRGSGLDSQGPSSDGGFKGPVLLGGTGIKLETSPESYDSSSAIQRATRMLAFHVLFDLVLERVSWLAFQELYDAALERESRRLSSNSCVICESAFADENCTVEVSEDLGPSSDGVFKGPALLGGTGINLVASPESYDSSAAIQRDRGLFDFMKPRTNRETSYSPAAIQMVGGSRLASHGRHNSDLAGVGLQGGARMHQSTNPVTNPELYHSYAAIQRRDRGSALDSQGPLSDGGFKGPALLGGTGISLVASSESDDSSAAIQRARSSRLVIQRRDRGSGLANSQGLSDSTPLEGQVLQGADDNVHRTHPMKWFDSLGSAGKAIYSALASLGVSDDALEDLESQGNAIPVSERIYYMLSEHNQSVQQWLRDAGTVGAGFSAVYASPSLATQLPAAVAFISVLTAMWLPRKCRRTKIILTKFGAIASIASVMSAMIKHLSPVGMGIAGALLLIPSGVVVFG